jgi:hypothetical protein
MSPERVIDDRRFPRGSATAQTGHEECLQRWLDEREFREIAQRSVRENAQAYEALREAGDREIERLRRWGLIAWSTAALVCVVGWGAVGLALWLLFHR